MTIDQVRTLFDELQMEGQGSVVFPRWPSADPATPVHATRPVDLGSVFDTFLGVGFDADAPLPLDGVELVGLRYDPAVETELVQVPESVIVELSWNDDHPWEPITGATLRLDHAILEWRGSDGTASLSGIAELHGGLSISATISLPELRIECELHNPSAPARLPAIAAPGDGDTGTFVERPSNPSTGESHAGFLHAHGFEMGHGPPTLRYLYLAGSREGLEFSASVDDLFTLGWLEVVDAQIHAEFMDGFGPGPTAAGVTAVVGIQLDDADRSILEIDVQAEKDSSGWSFSGSIIPPEHLSLGDIVDPVLDPAIGEQIPGFLRNLALEQLDLAFTQDGNDTSFACTIGEADADREAGAPLRVKSASVTVTDGAAEVEATVDFAFAIDGEDADVIATLERHDGVTKLRGDVQIPDGLDLSTLIHSFLDPENVTHVPDWLHGMEVTEVELIVEPTTGDFAAHCTVDWGHSDETTAVFALVHTPSGDGDAGPSTRIEGRITLHDLEFVAIFDQQSTSIKGEDARSSIGLFELDVKSDAAPVSLHQLGGSLLSGEIDASELPDLTIKLLDAAIAFDSDGSENPPRLLIAELDLALNITQFDQLPLVGPALANAESLQLSFAAVASSGTWTEAAIGSLTQLIESSSPARVIRVPNPMPAARVDAALRIGDGAVIDLTSSSAELPAEQPPAAAAAGASTGSGAGAGSDVTWHPIGRAFGPVHIDQIGIGFEHVNEDIEVLLKGSISVGGLTVSLLGFGGSYAPKTKTFTPVLHGLGLDVDRDPLEIGGEFLRVAPQGGSTVPSFEGGVLIGTEAFTLRAFGAFEMVGDQPSMFVYGILDRPLGGPAFFYVEKLAAGFGYNRRLELPKIDEVRSYPLVSAALDQSTSIPSGLHEKMGPEVGSYFLAVGVQASTYQLLDSVLVLALVAGPRTEIDLIGLCTFTTPPELPPGVPAMAHVELQLLGRLAPDEGVVSLRGQLSSSSYVYDRNCHLTGGFAFFSWFDGSGPGSYPNSGDFVISVGGYHPQFKIPSHYPAVPRVALHYRINDQLSVSGSAYFALTPGAFMAGASVEALYSSGSLRVSFRMGLDFLLMWKPYHYDIDIRIGIAAHWHWFHVDIHAQLHIWGPEFAGYAHVDWSMFSFSIPFGDQRRPSSRPIPWDEFRRSFLPAGDDKLAAVRVQDGAIGQYDDTIDEDTVTVWIVSAHDLVLASDSNIPEFEAGIAIRPMQRPLAADEGQQTLVVRHRDGTVATDLRTDLTSRPPDPVRKSYPAALWGPRISNPAGALREPTTVSAVAGHRWKITNTKPLADGVAKQKSVSHQDPIEAPAATIVTVTAGEWGPNTTTPERDDAPTRSDNPDLPWDDIVPVEVTA